MNNNRIKVTNTAIIIEDYTWHSCEKLEKPFQLFDPVTHKINYQGLYYDEDSKRLYLPAGMDLWYVKSCLNEKYYDRISCTKFKEFNENIGIKFKPRSEEQEEALKFMLGLREYENNQNLSQLSVNLSTGIGKTYCSIATITYFRINSIKLR
jgi:hypothetical protein